MNTIRRNQDSVKTYLALIIIIAGFCLISPSTAEAAIAVDSYSSGGTAGTTITISHTTSGTNRLMLVGVSINNDNYETVTGVTYNSVALTLVGTIANIDDARVEIWRLVAPDVGTYDVVITFSADLSWSAVAGVMTFTGVDQTTPLGTFASAAADGLTATVDVSSATGELVFGVVAAETPGSLTVGSGQTEYWNLTVDSGTTLGAGGTEPGATTVTTSWTLGTSDHWAIAGVPVKPAAAGAPDLDQIHYRWRNDNGEEEDGDTTQVSATADTTTTSTSDVLVDSMTITPGAGDYHIWFSGSVECSATSYQYVSLYVNGVQEAHTERQIRTEGSIPSTPFPVATHARVTGVTAGQAIEVRWRTTAGTATMHERTLAVTKITAADSTQASATADTTLSTTGVYSPLDSMSITPGAGDYMVWFSASLEGNTGNSRQDISIFVGGSEIAHSERQMYTESSILSTSFPVATHAKLTSVGASVAIEVRWRTTAGIATMHERTLVVYKINASDFTEVSDTVDATTTSAADVLIPGMTITPGAGDYLVWFSSSLECDLANNLNFQYVSIYVNGTQVAHTERELLQEESLGGTEFNVMTHACIENVGAAEAIEVRWRRANAGTVTMFERTLVVQSSSIGSGATWAANQDTSLTNLAKNTTRRLRLEVSNEGTAGSGDIAYRLEVSEPNPASPSTASYTRVDSSTHWNMTASTYFTDGDLTSNISSGLFDENTTFVDGQLKESTDETTTIALSTTQFTEIEYALQATGSAIDGATYYFRLTNAGVDSDFTYTSYAQVSLAGIAASLILADHPSGQIGDQFTTTTPVTDVLYRFKLTRSGTVTVDNVRVNFTTSGGVANGDVSSGELWEDADNDGVVDDPGDTQIQGSVTPSSGVLTFTTNFSPGTGGTNYLVRATVSNLTDGDTTTFSVGTDDIDEVEGGVTESGLIGNATHTQDSTTFTTNYRSIGTNTGTLYNTGNASIPSGTTTVTFGGGASLPEPTDVGAVGVGDKLVIGSETFYILSRDNATQVTVQSAATSTHSNASYTITRAYNDIQIWEDARNGNLVLNDYMEVGVCYKDGPFMPTATTTIDGSTTDATRYMLLTVATGQQHSGTAGTGVVVDGSNIASSHVFHVRDTYFRMELLEIRNYPGDTVSGQPISLNEGNAGNNLLSHLIIHDYTSTLRGAINVYENATVRNCIFYNGDVGIRTYSNPNLTLTLENVTIYGMTGTGVNHDKGKLIVKNTISVGSGNNRDFDLDNDAPVDGSSGYNMYSTVHNNIHPGASSGLISISFDGPTKTITRSTGSFVGDGFVIGNIINTDSGSNPGPFTITNVTALVITVSEAVTTQAASSSNVFLDVASVINQSPPASLDDLFISIISGSEDLHIELSGHDALDNGQDLSGFFTDDIDGESRSGTWDIGADEAVEVVCDYSYRKPITIQSSQVSGTSDLTNFPALVSLSGDWLKTTIADPTNGRIESANGYDIIFKDSTGTTQLDHEIESYDGSVSGGTLVAWVRIPILDYDDNTVIYMYYGSSCIRSSQENITGVWDDNYKAVWHLKETPTVDSYAYDSTSNDNNGTMTNMTSNNQVPGRIDGSLDFDGSDDLINLGNSTDFNVAHITVSAWAELDSTVSSTYPKIISKGNPEVLQMHWEGGHQCRVIVGGTSYGVMGDTVRNTLRQYVMTYDGETLEYFINGVSQGTNTTPTGNMTTNTANLVIGTRLTDARHWKGIIDEVRVSNTARSAGWIETSYNNQKENSTFIEEGDEQLLCDFSYRREITIQASEVVGSSNHLNFPMLVSLSGDWLKTTTAEPANGHIESDLGHDIIFRDTNLAQLDHEIEDYDGSVSGGTLVAWVRIHPLSYNTDTVIYMYYGNPCIDSSTQNVTGVWNDDYAAVWHLSQTPDTDGGTDEILDSNNSNHGDSQNMEAGDQTAGRINGALIFDGTDEQVTMVANASLDLSTNFTVSGWFYKNTSGAENLIYSSGITNTQYWTVRFDPSDKIEFNVDGTGGWSSSTAIGTGAWHHMTVVKAGDAGTNMSFYVDGQPNGTATVGSVPASTGQTRAIGYRPEGSDFYWSGKLDEIRISNIARLGDWIETSYNNQKENSTFYIVGDEDVLGDCSYSYYKPITIESDEVFGTSDHTDFPFLVNISSDTDLRTKANNGDVENIDGYDIIFRDSYGRQLDHEIEDYEPTTGKFVAWVRIPTLSLSVNTVIYMYYGNSCISSSQQNIPGVWNTNYKGVWHLSEDPSGTTPQMKDSTSNNNHGTSAGTMLTEDQIGGRVDGSLDFDGSDDCVDVGNLQSLAGSSELTMSVWFYANTLPSTLGDNYGIFLQHYDWDEQMGMRFDGNSEDLNAYVETGGVSAGVSIAYSGNIVINTWYHVVLTFKNGVSELFLDGVSKGTDDASSSFTTLPDLINNMFIASLDQRSGDYFDGFIDEVRISNFARSAGWIKTCYYNQKAGSTLYIIGDETSYAPTAVDLISFTATGQDESVLVEWETAQEIDNLGFNLYRSGEAYGSYTKLNSGLIPGLISSVKGRKYTYIDRNVTRDVLYYYMLEDVDLSGIRTMHGPVCVDWDGDGIADDYDEQTDDDDSDEDTDDGPEVRIPELRLYEVDFGPEGWTPSSSYASWVKLSSFSARQGDEGIALEWETSFEVGNIGFHVYRELDGKFYRITPDLVPGSVFKVGAGRELPAGQSYMYWDGLSEGTGHELYWLDCVELNGGRASFGPIKPEIYGQPVSERLKVRFESITEHQVSRARALGKVRELREELSTKPIQTQSSSATFRTVDPENPSDPRLQPNEEQWLLSAKSGVKIYIREDGWYRVGEPELVAAGLSPGVDPRYLQLYADGEEKSMMVTGSDDGRFDPLDAVEFYGTGLDTSFTDAHVYWLVVGSRPGRRVDTPFIDIRLDLGKRMRVPRGLRGRGAPLSFPFSLELKERTFYFAALKNGERENFFGSVISTEPVDQLLTVAHPDPSSPEDALLEVVLQGGTDSTHQIKIMFNYVEVGELGFSRQERGAVEIQVPHDLLLEGDNIVTLTAQGGSMDVSLVDYVRLTYLRTYTAAEDFLQFKANGREWLSIGGFSSSEIQVVDITDPMRMINIRGKVKAQDSGYAITVKVPNAGERTLLAFTEESIKQPAGIEANLASSWHEISQGAEVIIIAHSDLLESVEFLKQLREQQGWSVVLVDVEDLFDEFNFGSKNPWALRDFLNRAYAYWNPQPRFVLLVGDTSYDPRNYLGFGEFDLVPTKFVDTEYLSTASDDWFVDFDDDGLPEMAMGRLPVESAEEAATVVSKIIAYEGVAGLMNEALLVADINDSFDFEGASGEVADLLQGNITVREIFRGRSATARSDLLNLLNQGQLLVNYCGHGSTKIWNGNLLTSLDAWNLTNSPYLPFLVSMTCLNGFFQDPYIESMAETFLKAERGGAVAVWTSSGLTFPGRQVVMNLELIRLLFNGQGLTIGEAVMGAKRAVTDRDIRRTWILFGDPTLRLR